MKKILFAVLFVLAAVGCWTSFMLLRQPQHEITAQIVKYLGVKPGEAVQEKPPAPVQSETVVEEEQPAEQVAEEEQPAEPEQPVVVDPEAGKIWRGLTNENWYAGKKLTEKDFDGKVILVCVWGGKESVETLQRIEEVWSSFKGKPLLVIGSHRGGKNPKIPKVCSQLGLTFPMYEGLSFHREALSTAYPYIYIVNHHGKFAYRGTSHQSATAALVTAITACQLKQ